MRNVFMNDKGHIFYNGEMIRIADLIEINYLYEISCTAEYAYDNYEFDTYKDALDFATEVREIVGDTCECEFHAVEDLALEWNLKSLQ